MLYTWDKDEVFRPLSLLKKELTIRGRSRLFLQGHCVFWKEAKKGNDIHTCPRQSCSILPASYGTFHPSYSHTSSFDTSDHYWYLVYIMLGQILVP